MIIGRRLYSPQVLELSCLPCPIGRPVGSSDQLVPRYIEGTAMLKQAVDWLDHLVNRLVYQSQGKALCFKQLASSEIWLTSMSGLDPIQLEFGWD